MAELPTVLHMAVRDAMRKVIALSIEHGDDQEFIDWTVETDGFEVFSRHALWRSSELLVVDAANGELFPEGGADATAFDDVFETHGRREAGRWLRSRLVTSSLQQSPDGYGATQRVFYVPVGSKLEASRLRAPKTKHREMVRLMED